MGMFLNSIVPYESFRAAVGSYFVDKSEILDELIPALGIEERFICITRPRRFGKSTMANMIGAFFGKAADSSNVFNRLHIASSDNYRKHLNRHNVIYMDFSEEPERCNSYDVYITRILPIAKYSSGSELNMFLEYDMATKKKFSEYFGFLDKEVDDLYERYQKRTKDPAIAREDLRLWYDGYHMAKGETLYNPRSVVCALRDDQLSNYWTSSGPYDEIFYYVRNNIEEVRNDLAIMVSGGRVRAKMLEYAATAAELVTRDQIYSAMVIYGLLTYEDAARDRYRVEREDKAGEGYVDFIFYPERRGMDALILELKIDSTPDKAIHQIKDRNYALRLRGKLGEGNPYTGRMLAVGISYSRKTKVHSCKVEVLEG